MQVVSPLLKRVVYPSLARLGYLGSAERPGLAVITYHGVLPAEYQCIDAAFDGNLVSANTFRRQLQILRRSYNVISPAEMLLWCKGEIELPPRAVLLTCDDGCLNNVTEMLPILQEEDSQCLFFVTGASAGEQRTMLWHEELLLMFLRAPDGSFNVEMEGIELRGQLGEVKQRRMLWWKAVKQLSLTPAEVRDRFLLSAHSYFGLERSLDYYRKHHPGFEGSHCLMTRREMQQLANAGMTIGAHTLTHPVLTGVSAEAAWQEIAGSQAMLESAIGSVIWAFAYPYGSYDTVSSEMVTMAGRAGFLAAFVNVGGGLGEDLPRLAIPRVHVTHGMGLAEFEAHVSGFYNALQRGFGRRTQPFVLPSEAPLPMPLPQEVPISTPTSV